jgi:hypothetical protein
MLLHWVLTRDSATVLGMAGDYGMVIVDAERHSFSLARPKSWDDVVRQQAMNRGPSAEENLSEEQKMAMAVVTVEMEIIPAQNEIFRSLRLGKIHGWARPNGSGDIVRIEPIQWAGLRFCALEGHDVAVPVDSEKRPLPLQRPLADYLNGTVLATSMPTVWPDPLFPVEQAMRLWPPRTEPLQATPVAADPMPGDSAAITLSQVEELAEWIFAQHPQLRKFENLLATALRDLPDFKKGDFLSAYRLVYASEAHRPKIKGWPLRSPYRERARNEELIKNK